jgi:hypothetical protein
MGADPWRSSYPLVIIGVFYSSMRSTQRVEVADADVIYNILVLDRI